MTVPGLPPPRVKKSRACGSDHRSRCHSLRSSFRLHVAFGLRVINSPSLLLRRRLIHVRLLLESRRLREVNIIRQCCLFGTHERVLQCGGRKIRSAIINMGLAAELYIHPATADRATRQESTTVCHAEAAYSPSCARSPCSGRLPFPKPVLRLPPSSSDSCKRPWEPYQPSRPSAALSSTCRSGMLRPMDDS